MVLEEKGTVRVQLGGLGEERSLVKKVPRGGGVAGVVVPAGVILLVVFAGVGTGWVLAQKLGGGETQGMGAVTVGTTTKEGVGICKDETTFRDLAEGELVEGGVDGEGTHHLVRDGGPSQYVYLTSTSVDLDEFVGKKVKVLGETVGGQKAGWLMDVGCVKVL